MVKNAIKKYFKGNCLLLMVLFTKTTFAQDTNIKDFGAIDDGQTINTVAIQKAIDQTALKGGTVTIPQGELLKGSPNLKDYPENIPSVKGMKPHRSWWKSMPSKALIYADSVTNISILGEGTIDGNGTSQAFMKKDDDPDRPKMIFVVNCKKVRVENLRLT
jgi:polygalacturonase